MTASVSSRLAEPRAVGKNHEILTTLIAACERIAPTWPLDRWIAVNPWWGHRHQAIEKADTELCTRANIGLLMPEDFYLDAWQGSRIRECDLLAAAGERQSHASAAQLVNQLRTARRPQAGSRSSLACGGNLDSINRLLGDLCARYFDKRQGRWRADIGDQNLYQYWLGQQSLGGGSTAGDSEDRLADLPADWEQAAIFVATELACAGTPLGALVHKLLLRLPGWASWCRGEDWRAGLEGQVLYLCPQLATILLVYEWLAVIELSERDLNAWQLWSVGATNDAAGDSKHILWIWHRAYEMAWQRQFLERWQSKPKPEKPETAAPEVQAAFCIDVRSEVFRRHLESAYPKAETLGVAGFFGMPVVHQTLGPSSDEAHLPGLLAPVYRFGETQGSHAADLALNRQLDRREQVRESVRSAKYSSLSTFTLVETTGLAWAWKLVRDSLHRNQPKQPRSPEGRLFHCHGGDPLSDRERVDLAESLLRAMSLTRRFASVLLLVGHGAHTDNNPNQAGLACGACGGKNGGVNASIAADLLNDRSVRAGLAQRGIVLPESTLVLAAEHCTVTDDVRIFEGKGIPQSHQRIYDTLVNQLRSAGSACRRERATALKLNGHSDQQLHAEMQRRTHNWAEVRPEWGLANNAAMIIGPRHATRELNLGGRCFLHEYNPELDTNGSVLSALMSAPMVVANWINLQYFASVSEPGVYGAGNKLLHSVVGGNLGVIEGNGADLSIGLPMQSVHDGERWRHEPMRLTVLIDAPAARIEQVLSAHPDVRALVDNQWLWLWRVADTGIEQYCARDWQAI
ncbi:MAG: hypothetical protein HLUCCX14_02915 [Marinobacter excellens HL-55]|uniref:Probable inorganic carbon transporter subunit DabA n=1 Tax=Marinobacter excellens HL-55 TaxID=1305731 RepID=A0A0P7Z6B2_9GAMM|nr:MAG: hypothetical protein HLUCCX14_02915 [Marinobacter excellens HL-55]